MDHNKNGYKLKGASKRKKTYNTRGRLFGYVAKIIKERNASIISSTMYMLMWF